MPGIRPGMTIELILHYMNEPENYQCRPDGLLSIET